MSTTSCVTEAEGAGRLAQDSCGQPWTKGSSLKSISLHRMLHAVVYGQHSQTSGCARVLDTIMHISVEDLSISGHLSI